MRPMKKIYTYQATYHAAVAGETAFPHLWYLKRVRHEVGEVIKKHLPQSGTDDGADENVLYDEYQMVLAEIFFL